MEEEFTVHTLTEAHDSRSDLQVPSLTTGPPLSTAVIPSSSNAHFLFLATLGKLAVLPWGLSLLGVISIKGFSQC